MNFKKVHFRYLAWEGIPSRGLIIKDIYPPETISVPAPSYAIIGFHPVKVR